MLKIILGSSLLVCIISAGSAQAQSPVVRFTFNAVSDVTCNRPLQVANMAVASSGRGVLNADGTASLDLNMTASPPVRINAKLGGGAAPAPFGTARLNVVNRNQLRAVWSLPNNDLVMNFKVARDGSCQATMVSQLRRGAREHTVPTAGQLAYCSNVRTREITCTGT